MFEVFVWFIIIIVLIVLYGCAFGGFDRNNDCNG